jgi:hypothetical protein
MRISAVHLTGSAVILALVCCPPPARSQRAVPRFEVSGLAGASGLRSELVSTYGPYDFGADASRVGGELGAVFGFRPAPKLGVEIEAVRIGHHEFHVREDLGADILDLEKDYYGYGVSGNLLFHPWRFATGDDDLVEPYVTAGLGVLHLGSTTTDTRLDPPGGFCTFLDCVFPTVDEQRITRATTNELGYNLGAGLKAYLYPRFFLRPEYRFLGSASARIHRVSLGFGFHW